MVSLLKLAKITEEGVEFQHPHDGARMMLTPEHSIALQNSIGADIIMQLDDVVSSLISGPRVEEAMHRSIRWYVCSVCVQRERGGSGCGLAQRLDRCIKAHGRQDSQNLFAIVQGGLDPELRKACIAGM